MPDTPVPWFEAPSMHTETAERSVSLTTELFLMLITGLASSRRIGDWDEPVLRMNKYNTESGPPRRPPFPCLRTYGDSRRMRKLFFRRVGISPDPCPRRPHGLRRWPAHRHRSGAGREAVG